MALTLRVDGPRWRSHLRAVLEAHPGLVPVAKGNGYGLGLGRLARRAEWLGVDTLAVGTYEELAEVGQRFDGSLLVLSPWRPGADDLHDVDEGRLVHTVSRLQDVQALADPGRDRGRSRVVLERLTSMRRHGLSARELREAVRTAASGGLEIEGVALHLPLPHGATRGHLAEVEHLMNDVVAAGVGQGRSQRAPATVWVSHLDEMELELLSARYPDFRFRPRIGTALWLGDRESLAPRATVLDRHAVERGDTFGYRGRTAPRTGTLLVVAGGTSHGIGLEAPTGDQTLRARAASIARGGLDAAGFVRSPFIIGDKHRLFAEPPHMQCSMLFLPAGTRVPEVGDEVEVRVRYTITAFDHVEIVG